jgi:hypothetical protein
MFQIVKLLPVIDNMSLDLTIKHYIDYPDSYLYVLIHRYKTLTQYK